MQFDIADFFSWYIALIVAMVFHEAAHAWVAYLGGDRTAYAAGQVTINPIPHMRREPFGTIILPILSYAFFHFPMGFAHAPYNPYWADAHPRRAALMSAAGPLANLALAALMFGLMKWGLSADWFETPFVKRLDMMVAARDGAKSGFLYAAARIASLFFFLNLLLCLFNVIPLPPLDGAGIMEGLLPAPLSRLYATLRSNSMLAIVGLLVAWQVIGNLILPAWLWCYRTLHS